MTDKNDDQKLSLLRPFCPQQGNCETHRQYQLKLNEKLDERIEDVEKRLRHLELRIAYWAGGAIVLGTLINSLGREVLAALTR